ncbi:UDP-glucuronate:xylan alpha-glucuronosyltransferase 2 isoform X2 [Gastrolobium bilobum]|uniref:UDP-glucuronate:xylan alpha-glucuronosyltransferase 2 isoform X2 n=1 Tax=Gastrolobium bilobum TaxID=150636 RepID=UPI002AB2237A|nr:UDP-glucuronate:xylan alpha-glucuronosyltransferase 2 isoform X2 [Gastrolobium bilobum]
MQGSSLEKMLKTVPSKALVTRINLVFLLVFLVVYATLLLRPSSSVYFENAASLVRCSLRECHHKVSFKMKAVLEEPQAKSEKQNKSAIKIEVPGFFRELGKGMKIGMVNMNEDDVSEWSSHGETIPVHFERVSQFFNWTDLFPEWIDEEEESDVPSCPEIPMPEYADYGSMDVIVAKLPCKYPEEGWGRDVFRLQVHLIVANLAVKNGKRNWKWKTRVVLFSKCRPMLELFPCDHLVRREGDWWYYEPDFTRLEHKVSLPVGSCKLALPLWEQGIDEVYDLSKIEKSVTSRGRIKREAYATVLHSSEAYVCGAITLAQSLVQTGTQRDLILLIDKSISVPKRQALADAGWKIRIINRIRNPKAEKGSYNEYNYSKFRLWQLTDYDRIIFIDSDIIVLRKLDILFHFPQISATGNDQSIFNSGIMVIEPSNCTFGILMSHRNDIVSYNGGDQGFLNEVFVWWHRLPRRVNFLKNFWANTTLEASVKNGLLGAEPPKVYAIHYLGWKPWHCYRDYDCNWDVEEQRVYASDVAHRRWWKLHDAMDESLQSLCRLTKQRRTELNWERRKAGKKGLPDGHWKINITDPRRLGSLLIH